MSWRNKRRCTGWSSLQISKKSPPLRWRDHRPLHRCRQPRHRRCRKRSPLFSIARTDVLRVQVFVPQTAYFGVRQGDHATVTVPEIVNRTFDGTVARNARALATGTRTLLTEVDVDNKAANSLRVFILLSVCNSGA